MTGLSASNSAGGSSKPFSLPEGFRFGVATSGFQVEGGYNGPGEPQNNWYRWEKSGQVEPSGIALDFWDRWEEQLDRAVEAGCDAFRLSVEWARCEPQPGRLDGAAFERYGEILEGCHQRGMQPLVTLHHFTHPGWLGEDFWLQSEAPERFAQWARNAVGRLGNLCRHWVTVNEPNICAINGYLTGAFPPGRRLARSAAMRALDHLLTGHVLAYGEIHALQPEAVVSTNLFAYSAYHLDRLAVDLLLARRNGVSREYLPVWLAERRAAYEATLPKSGMVERLLRRVIGAALPLEQMLPRTAAAVYDSPHGCTLDVTQIDYYDPVVSNHVRLPGHRTSGGRHWFPSRLLWDDRPDPDGLITYSRAHHEPGLDLWVLENGLCSRVRDGLAYARTDGWDRLRYLRENLAAVVRAIDAGVPVGSYYHWTLADSYEWGSYEPRFGLYRIERKGGSVGWGSLDALGGDAAALYRRIVEGLRAGDRSVLDGSEV